MNPVSTTQTPDLGRQVLQEINRVRANPPAYAEELQELRQYYQGNIYQPPGQIALTTNEGVVALDDAIADLRNIKAMLTLNWSEGLAKAAKDHVKDTGAKGIIGHTGSDGSTLTTRIQRYGKFPHGGTWAENISYAASNAKDIVRSLIIDDGVPNRGHRRNILSPQIIQVGIAEGKHSKYNTMCVIDFALGYQENPF